MAEMRTNDALWAAEVATYNNDASLEDRAAARTRRRLRMRETEDPRLGWYAAPDGGGALVDLVMEGMPLTPYLAHLQHLGRLASSEAKQQEMYDRMGWQLVAPFSARIIDVSAKD